MYKYLNNWLQTLLSLRLSTFYFNMHFVYINLFPWLMQIVTLYNIMKSKTHNWILQVKNIWSFYFKNKILYTLTQRKGTFSWLCIKNIWFLFETYQLHSVRSFKRPQKFQSLSKVTGYGEFRGRKSGNKHPDSQYFSHRASFQLSNMNFVFEL